MSTGSTTTELLDAELLEELRKRLPEQLFEQLTRSIHSVELENRYLRELVRLERIAKYGPASEQLSDEQLELLEQKPGVSATELKAESERVQLQLPLKRPKQTPARQTLPAELPRIEQLIACSGQECICRACGREKVVIGYETAEQLDVEPAKYFVRVTKPRNEPVPTVRNKE